jgi:hypothetical protein
VVTAPRSKRDERKPWRFNSALLGTMEGVRLVEERRWKRRTGSHLRAFESPTFRTLEAPADWCRPRP